MHRAIFIMILLFLTGCKLNTEGEITPAVLTVSQPIQNSALKASMERGGLVYIDFCMQCHLGNGAGVPGSFPPLAPSDWLSEKRTESIHAVKFGQKGEITVNGTLYNGLMAPMGLTNEEIADVMNYIMNSWGNTQDKMVTPDEVEAVEK